MREIQRPKVIKSNPIKGRLHFRNSKSNTVVSLKSVLAYVANFSEKSDFQDCSFFANTQKSRQIKVQIFRKCSRYVHFDLSVKVDGTIVWTSTVQKCSSKRFKKSFWRSMGVDGDCPTIQILESGPLKFKVMI